MRVESTQTQRHVPRVEHGPPIAVWRLVKIANKGAEPPVATVRSARSRRVSCSVGSATAERAPHASVAKRANDLKESIATRECVESGVYAREARWRGLVGFGGGCLEERRGVPRMRTRLVFIREESVVTRAALPDKLRT